MGRIVILIAILWFTIYVLSTVAIVFLNEIPELSAIAGSLMNNPIQKILASVLQVALLLFVVIEAARRLGLVGETGFRLTGSLSEMRHVQATIALLVVGAFCLAAVAGLSGAGALKDLALVVVGFYFGTRVRKDEDVAWLTEEKNGRPNTSSGVPEEERKPS